MKSCNQIIFVVSCFTFSAVVAMEIVPTQQGKWYIDIDKNSVEQFVGGSVRYDDEYKAREFHKKNIVSFPVECTDPLPIEYCGSKRFFMTSATGSGWPGEEGDALIILDPMIKQLAVVRGITHNNTRIHVYVGLETDNVKIIDSIGCKKIYPAKILAFQIKEKSNSQFKYLYRKCFMYHRVMHFGGMQLMEEVRKNFPEVKTCNFDDYFKKLLDRYAQDFDFEKLQFDFQKCYWSAKENQLKGITYHSVNK
jgi:hypothetical protein